VSEDHGHILSENIKAKRSLRLGVVVLGVLELKGFEPLVVLGIRGKALRGGCAERGGVLGGTTEDDEDGNESHLSGAIQHVWEAGVATPRRREGLGVGER
jgi:hypothetical protein